MISAGLVERSLASSVNHFTEGRSMYARQLGMGMISTWEQSAVFDPTNPHQIQKIAYAQIPGRYTSYYYNRVPTTSVLKGALGDVLDPSTWSPTMQFILVGLASAAAGYFGWKKFGDDIETRYHKFRGK